MKRALISVFLWCLGASALAQEILTQDHFSSPGTSLLLIDLHRTDIVDASFHSNKLAEKEFQWSALPFELRSPQFSSAHPILVLSQNAPAIFAYNMQPTASGSTELLKFLVHPSFAEQDFNDQFVFSPPHDGLFIFRNGLRYRIYFRSDPPEKLMFEGMAPIDVSQVDAVGFILPDGYQGRTISNSGSMFQPQPETLSPIVRFSLKSQAVNEIAIDFSLPEPAWFQDVTDFLLKAVGVLLPVLLLILTKPNDVNRARYKVVAIGLGLVVVAIYGGLSVYAHIQGLGFRKIAANAVFAAITVGATYATYWITSKEDP